MDIKKLHPIILIGEGLGEKYKALPIGEKKKVAILSDIEMSNIPASLSHKRNISKNTLRKFATRLDVYPAIFFIPARCIQPECLVYKEDEGIVKVSDVRSILNSTVMDLSQETDPSDSFLYEREVYLMLDQLFEKLQRYNRSSISKQQFVRNLTPIMIQLFSLMANNLS